MSKRLLLLVSMLLCLAVAVPVQAAPPAVRAMSGDKIATATARPVPPWQVIFDALGVLFGWPRQAPEPEPAPEPVRIEFWHALSPESKPGQALEALVKRYNASQRETVVIPMYQGIYSDVEKKFVAAFAAAKPPAIVHTLPWTIRSGGQQEAFLPLDSLVPAAAQADYPANLLDAHRHAGRLYGLPFNQSVYVMVYNRTKVPTPPLTWDEFHATATEITIRGTFDGTAFAGDAYLFGLFLHQAGGQWLQNGKAAFNSDAGVLALGFMRDLVKDGAARMLQPREYPTNYFNGGRVGLIFTTSASLPYIKLSGGQAWGVAPLPAGPMNYGSVASGGSLAIANNLPPEQRKAAAEFLLWLTGKEAMVEWAMAGTGYLPVRKSALSDPRWQAYLTANPDIKVASDAVLGSVVLPNDPRWSGAMNAITMAVEKTLLGGSEPKEALDQAAERVNSLLSK